MHWTESIRLWTAQIFSCVKVVCGHNWWDWSSTVFCPLKNIFANQSNTWIFERDCSLYCAQSFLKISHSLLHKKNLIMCCAMYECTPVLVTVLLTRHETYATSPGEGLTSDVPTNIRRRLCYAPFIHSAAVQEFWYIFDPPSYLVFL